MVSHPSLLAAEAHLYLADPDEWTRGDGLATALALLSAGERERYDRFRVDRPARAYATGRALARQALSLYAATAPRDWVLEPDEHGRPRIVGLAGHGLEFNLSHNDQLVACLITGGIECGIDVESLARRVDPMRIAEHSFGEDEVRDLEERRGDDCRRRFFTYWTLKEAYLKARGRGIAMRMDSALFRFPQDGRIDVDFAPRTGDRAEEWQLALYRAGGEQLLAVALRRPAGRDLEIRAFRARPGEPRAEVATLALERASEPPVGAGR